MKKLIFLLLVFCVINLHLVKSLKCWQCSSNSSMGSFCADPFNDTALGSSRRYFTYIECPNSSINMKPVCKKIHQKVDGKDIYSRRCGLEDKKAKAEDCLDPSVKAESCEKCYTDGCNGQALNPTTNRS